jgi:hypothetical protein
MRPEHFKYLYGEYEACDTCLYSNYLIDMSFKCHKHDFIFEDKEQSDHICDDWEI